MSAVKRQFWREPPQLEFKDHCYKPMLIGHAIDVSTVGLSSKLWSHISIMQSRALSWHTDSDQSSYILLQVIQGKGFRVQGTDKSTAEQPIGTVILLDQGKRHRLLAPSPKFNQIWTARYVPIGCSEADAMTDDELFGCFEVANMEKRIRELLDK